MSGTPVPGLREVTLRQLQIFASAARTLSFSRTGQELRLSQPGVSMQVKQLEEAAGLPLFERLKRRLYLTEAGREMVGHADQVLRALSAAEESFAVLRGGRGGRIAVTVTSTAKYFAPRLFARFAAQHPEVEMTLSVHNREAVVQQLADNEADLVIMGTPPEELETVAVPFAEHPFVIAGPPGHRLAHRRRLPLAALADERFLVRERGSGTRAAMERFLKERGLAVRVSMEISSNETIKQAVMAGLGVSFISQHTIGLELAVGQLVQLRVEGLPVLRRWYVVHRKDKRLSPTAQAFQRFVVSEGASFLKRWPRHLAPAGRAAGPGA